MADATGTNAFPAHLDQMSAISSYLEERMLALGLTPEVIFEVQVAVDEACTNIIQHAFPNRQDGKIYISCDKKDGLLIIQIEDNGIPYDPTQNPPPDLTSSLEDRKPGGLGVHFMRQFMDELQYECSEGTETLTMKKRVKPS
jgi:serine/threonine-protein kinase RsbW